MKSVTLLTSTAWSWHVDSNTLQMIASLHVTKDPSQVGYYAGLIVSGSTGL
jgi:hypothetical protein